MKLYILALLLCITFTEENNIILPVTKRKKIINISNGSGNKRDVESHQAALFNDDGSEYLINIGIGTPMQNFTLSLDTGSSDLWVPSITCPIDQCPLARFDPTESTTYLAVNDGHGSLSFHVEYGIGSVNGTYGRDHIYLGNAHVPHQLFGLATATHDLILVTSNNTNEISNGIFGLGHPSLTTSSMKYEPFLFQIANQGVIDQPIFSISMGSRLDQGWSGEMMIGGTNPEKYTGAIQYAPVISNSTYWMVGGKSIQVLKRDTHQEVVYNSTFKSIRGTIIDTGTTLTYVDYELAQDIIKSVVGKSEENNVVLDKVSGTFILNCQAVQFNDPTVDYFVQFILENGIIISIPAKDLIIPLDNSHTLCMFGIAPWMSTGTGVKMNEKGWILIGDSVLRSTYLVFDMKKNQIGFAKASYHQKEIISNEQVSSSAAGATHIRNNRNILPLVYIIIVPVTLLIVTIETWSVLLK